MRMKIYKMRELINGKFKKKRYFFDYNYPAEDEAAEVAANA